MRKIRVLDIEFENEIAAYEVPAFRGAVIETAGRRNTLFHNHIGNDFLHGYPLIQYKRINKKPHLVCIQEGIDEIHHFFNNKQEGLFLGNRSYELTVDQIMLQKHLVQIHDRSFEFSIQNWLPLSQKNYHQFQKMSSEMERLKFFERILVGNILSFAKGIQWKVEKNIKLRIIEINRTNIIKVKGINRQAFSLIFEANIFLPDHIGLGRNTSLGFGIVKKHMNENRLH